MAPARTDNCRIAKSSSTSMFICGGGSFFPTANLAERRLRLLVNYERAVAIGESTSLLRHIFLDIGPCFGYKCHGISPAYRTAAGDTGCRGECGSRGRRLVTAAPGRLREITPGRHDDRSAGQPAGLGQEGAGNARW